MDSTSDSMVTNTNEVIDEEVGEDADESTQISSIRRGNRTRPPINYKDLSGVREYNRNKQMMQLSRKILRKEHLGANKYV